MALREYWDMDGVDGKTAYLCGIVQALMEEYISPLLDGWQEMGVCSDVFYIGGHQVNGADARTLEQYRDERYEDIERAPLTQAMRERCAHYADIIRGDPTDEHSVLPRHDDFNFELPEPVECSLEEAVGMSLIDNPYVDDDTVQTSIRNYVYELHDYFDCRDYEVYPATKEIIDQLTACHHYDYVVDLAVFIRLGDYVLMHTLGVD